MRKKIFLLIILILFIAGLSVGKDGDKEEKKGDIILKIDADRNIKLTPKKLDLGDIKKGEKAHFKIYIENRSEDRYKFYLTACGCIKLASFYFKLDSYQATTIEADFDSTNYLNKFEKKIQFNVIATNYAAYEKYYNTVVYGVVKR